jgi:hypothetical protein
VQIASRKIAMRNERQSDAQGIRCLFSTRSGFDILIGCKLNGWWAGGR